MSISLETLVLARKYTKKAIENTLTGTTGTITLGADWTANGATYTQTVTIPDYNVTANTRVDLVADPAVLTQMEADGVEQIYVVNDDGVLTAYAVDGQPSVALTVRILLTEVS